MIIFKQRGKFKFREDSGRLRKFNTLKEAVDAGGIAPDEEVQVSGVPYTVPAKNINMGDLPEEDEGEN